MFNICDMKKLIVLSMVFVSLMACSFALPGKIIIGNGVRAEKAFDLGTFDAVSVNGSADVIFRQGTQKVLLVADENILDLFEIVVKDGTLCVGTKKGSNYSSKNDVVVFVNSPVLKAAKINGSGECDIKGTLRCADDFSFSINGSGDLEADEIECRNFAAKVSGSGDIEVNALTAASADIRINGSGDVSLNCREVGDIVAGINGSGDVELQGKARSLSSKVHGSGEIDSRRLNLL